MKPVRGQVLAHALDHVRTVAVDPHKVLLRQGRSELVNAFLHVLNLLPCQIDVSRPFQGGGADELGQQLHVLALRALVGDAWWAVDVIVVLARASQSASEHNPASGLQRQSTDGAVALQQGNQLREGGGVRLPQQMVATKTNLARCILDPIRAMLENELCGGSPAIPAQRGLLLDVRVKHQKRHLHPAEAAMVAIVRTRRRVKDLVLLCLALASILIRAPAVVDEPIDPFLRHLVGPNLPAIIVQCLEQPLVQEEMHLLRTLLEPSLVVPTKIQHGSHGAHADIGEFRRFGNGTENALKCDAQLLWWSATLLTDERLHLAQPLPKRHHDRVVHLNGLAVLSIWQNSVLAMSIVQQLPRLGQVVLRRLVQGRNDLVVVAVKGTHRLARVAYSAQQLRVEVLRVWKIWHLITGAVFQAHSHQLRDFARQAFLLVGRGAKCSLKGSRSALSSLQPALDEGVPDILRRPRCRGQ